MPEYLAPGVYVEEISFRAKSIEGVSTSVAGFIGPARYGPTDGPPELLTSFADFTRIYGGVDPLTFDGAGEPTPNYLAHAVRAFFDNGGSKLYVTRVYQQGATSGFAQLVLGSPASVTLQARFPGTAGNMRIVFALRPSANMLGGSSAAPTLRGARVGDVVYLVPTDSPPSLSAGLYDVQAGAHGLELSGQGSPIALNALDPTKQQVFPITLTVRARLAGAFDDEQVWEGLSPGPVTRGALLDLFQLTPPSRLRYLTIPFAISSSLTSGADLLGQLFNSAVLTKLGTLLAGTSRPAPSELEQSYTLSSGNDGALPSANTYQGDDSGPEKSGLYTFEDIDAISIVAAPGHSAAYADNAARVDQIVQSLIIHCQLRMRYRVAVLDAPPGLALSEIQQFRGALDSTHAALYYPWIKVVDPLDPEGRRELHLPPSGFVAGIYARTDVLHGVAKAPANEVVLGAIGFEQLINKAQQDILNPQGINCFRFFEGRGFRLWGARTISSDPEWKYLNVRRYFAYLEHSIDKGTQWAVFENNGDRLWANVRRTVEDFLFNEWRNGALLGLKPEQAFFVRCDRTTMTQNDLDNGRLICLIGVAPLKPAEFVIFRIGQFTADSRS